MTIAVERHRPDVEAARRILFVEGKGSTVGRPRSRQLVTVAHELQHAVEIAEHPEVNDASAALRLYRNIAIGRCREGLSEECETARAVVTERKVFGELYARFEKP